MESHFDPLERMSCARDMRFLRAGAIENRARFERRLLRLYGSPADERYRHVMRAYDSAEEAFKEIYRESGELYFEHLRATALICIDYLGVTNATVIAAALLHDSIEDTPWTIRHLRRYIGDETTELVWWVTKPDAAGAVWPGTSRRAARVSGDSYETQLLLALDQKPYAVVVKLADRLHNLVTLWHCDEAKIRRKVEETKTVYMPLARRAQVLVKELEEAVKALEQNLSYHDAL